MIQFDKNHLESYISDIKGVRLWLIGRDFPDFPDNFKKNIIDRLIEEDLLYIVHALVWVDNGYSFTYLVGNLYQNVNNECNKPMESEKHYYKNNRYPRCKVSIDIDHVSEIGPFREINLSYEIYDYMIKLAVENKQDEFIKLNWRYMGSLKTHDLVDNVSESWAMKNLYPMAGGSSCRRSHKYSMIELHREIIRSISVPRDFKNRMMRDNIISLTPDGFFIQKQYIYSLDVYSKTCKRIEFEYNYKYNGKVTWVPSRPT